MASTVERQKTATLTQRLVAERTISIQRTVVEENSFNMGEGGKKGGFNTEGGGGEDGSAGGIRYSTGT